MSSTGSLKISVFDASREPWRGPEIQLVIRDPFANSSNKKLVDESIKKGTNVITVENLPTDKGQQYILFLDAKNHRGHSVYPVKPESGAETPLNVMVIPKDPVTRDFLLVLKKRSTVRCRLERKYPLPKRKETNPSQIPNGTISQIQGLLPQVKRVVQ